MDLSLHTKKYLSSRGPSGEVGYPPHRLRGSRRPGSISVAARYQSRSDRLGNSGGPARRGLAPFRFTFVRTKVNCGVWGRIAPNSKHRGRSRRTGPESADTQQSFAPAGILSSTIMRFSFSSPFSLWTAEISMPQLSWPIIFRGGRFTMATRVLPTSSSGL